MTGTTHAMAGFCAGGLLLTALPYIGMEPLTGYLQPMLVLPCATLSALLPDIDLPDSTIGKSVWPISKLINALFGHRTMCHSLTFWGLLLYLAYHFFPPGKIYYLAAAAGILSHLILDMLNKSGVALLWPIKTKFSIASCPLRGMTENILTLAFAVAGIVMWFRQLTGLFLNAT